jgi:SAM-dependent methyltransferase
MTLKTINDLQKRNSNLAYAESAKAYGVSHEAVRWSGKSSQELRFRQLLKHLALTKSIQTLADVGCGNCELYSLIERQGLPIEYTGMDINNELLRQAESRFEGITTINADITNEHGIFPQFDYVVMSGVFNLAAGQNQEWCEAFVSSMYAMSRRAIAFNALSTHVNFIEDDMFYLSPSAIFKFVLERLSPHVILEHGVPPYNYTLTVFKDAQ